MIYSFDDNTPQIGKDTYISESATVIGNVIISDNCYVGHGAIIRGDYGRIEIGSGTAVEEGVIVHSPPGKTNKIGKNVTIGHGAILHGDNIGDFAVIGMGAILSLRSKVGEWTIIAEGSIVKMNKNIPDRVVAEGNPAEIIRETKPADERIWKYAKKIYVDLAKKYIESPMQLVK